ncbi:hypothetical protein QWM81_20565 [Streptomyces ficellus]|uniref:Uncharacterized protein n=1 Tax=Streptomyces ficellus TaxID=1977088 RepID=A0ABT7ZA78_9ACTN|nr:hypothetical protein [Streptomyces ficellus]MDN3296409.1 hypothetical protein [Streptomyces ficellus]
MVVTLLIARLEASCLYRDVHQRFFCRVRHSNAAMTDGEGTSAGSSPNMARVSKRTVDAA